MFKDRTYDAIRMQCLSLHAADGAIIMHTVSSNMLKPMTIGKVPNQVTC